MYEPPAQPSPRADHPALRPTATGGSTASRCQQSAAHSMRDVPPGVYTMRILNIDLGRRTPSRLHSALRAAATSYVVENSPQQGVAMCREGEYSVAVLCVDRSGPAEAAFAAHLRAARSSTPLLVVAGQATCGDLVDTLDSGADDYLPGDRPPAELVARVRALARREPHITPERTSHGDITVDRRAHRAWCGDRELRLTSHQLALLETFVRHRGRALTRPQLVELVWDPGCEVSSNVVDQAVAALRRAVGRAHVTTVRGVGYRLEGS